MEISLWVGIEDEDNLTPAVDGDEATFKSFVKGVPGVTLREGCALILRRHAADARRAVKRDRGGAACSIAARSLPSSSRARVPIARTCAARSPRPCPFARSA